LIIELFTKLTQALSITNAPFIVFTAVFIWGILSIILSPCHLSSIPLIIGFLSNQKDLNIKKTFFYTLLFSIGILISTVIIGVVTGLIGRILGDIGPVGNTIMALLFFIIGLYLLGIIQIPILDKINQPQYQKRGLLSAWILGILFGFAVGPCTFAYLAPILGIIFKTATINLFYAVSLIFFYALGHCLIIIFVGISFDAVEKLLKLNEESKAINILKKICGILVIIGGIYILIDSLKQFGLL
jgi:cytochrome c-type biogenesis protein